MSNRWVTDKGKTNRRTGEAVRFPLLGDPGDLPSLDYPATTAGISDDKGTGEWEHFTTMMIDETDDVHVHQGLARDSDDAHNNALENYEGTAKIKTVIVHDGLGDAVSKLVMGLGKGVVKGAHGAAQIGITAGKYAGQAAAYGGQLVAEGARGTALTAGRAAASYQTLRREYTIGRLERLIGDASSQDPARRAIAKYQLKRDYPAIYKNIAWTSV